MPTPRAATTPSVLVEGSRVVLPVSPVRLLCAAMGHTTAGGAMVTRSAQQPLISVPANTKPLDVDLVRSLIDVGRFHAALSYFTTRSLPPWRLQELHEMLQFCFQSLLLEGLSLSVELLTEAELSLVESVDITDPEWLAFVDWVSRDFGTAYLGPILYPIGFRSDQAAAFINGILQQDCSHKDLLALLCVSQITGYASAELVEVAVRMADNDRLKMFSLRCLSEWVSLTSRHDEEMVSVLIRRVLKATSNLNDFLTAAYILEKLAAPRMCRYQLALTAIEKADSAGLDSNVTDHFHVYILRDLSCQELGELKTFASSPRWQANMFRESLLLSLEAWLHIRGTEPPAETAIGFSEYLAALSERFYADGGGPTPSEPDVPIRLTESQIRILRALAAGDSSQPSSAISSALSALEADTARLELS